MDGPGFHCATCGKYFENLFKLSKHKRIKHESKVYKLKELRNFYTCAICKSEFLTLEELFKHLKKCEFERSNYICNVCGNIYLTKNSLIKHCLRCISQLGYGTSNRLPRLDDNSKFHISKTAFRSFLQQYEFSQKKNSEMYQNF